MNDLYTNFICQPSGDDTPGWLVAAICAIPVVLVVIDMLG